MKKINILKNNRDFNRIIDSYKSHKYKDFGQGFYLTDIYEQARGMAIRRCEFEENGTPIVQTYKFDESLLRKDLLKIKIFENVSTEWAEFILINRKSH